MKILVDARYLTNSFGGIRMYSECLLQALSVIDSENEYVVVARSDYRNQLPLGPNFRFIHYDAAAVSLKTIFGLHRLIEKEQPDVVHSHYPITPAFYCGRLVVTVYDLQPLQMRQWTGGRPLPLKLLYDAFYHWQYPASFRRADRLLCISEATRQALIALNPKFGAKAMVTPLGLPHGLLDQMQSASIEALREQFSIPPRYLLYVGSTRPNKNIPAMLRAFAMMRGTHPDLRDVAFVLVLVKDRFFAEIQNTIDELKIHSSIMIPPDITLEQKRALYQHAQALFFATKYEGFGLPVLEGQAMGVPVLASTADALPETAGQGALLANADDVGDMASKLATIISDAALRQSLIERGKANLQRFDWMNTAKLTLSALV